MDDKHWPFKSNSGQGCQNRPSCIIQINTCLWLPQCSWNEDHHYEVEHFLSKWHAKRKLDMHLQMGNIKISDWVNKRIWDLSRRNMCCRILGLCSLVQERRHHKTGFLTQGVILQSSLQPLLYLLPHLSFYPLLCPLLSVVRWSGLPKQLCNGTKF